MSKGTTPAGHEPGPSSTVGEPSSGETAPPAEDFVVASHTVLFQVGEPTVCDACGEPLDREDDREDEGYSFPGCGVYVWARGDEVTREKAPLCGSCASAIGMTALARWEIEEEEG